MVKKKAQGSEPDGEPGPIQVSHYVLHPEDDKLAIGKISALGRRRFRGVFFKEPIAVSLIASKPPTFRTSDIIIRPSRRAVRWAMTHLFNSRLTTQAA